MKINLRQSKMKLTKLTLAILTTGLMASSADAAKKGPLPVTEINRAKPVDFQSEILPILRANCLACHNRTKAKADLILETPQDIAEADSVVPGKPEESILFTSSTHAEDPAMPPMENKVSARALNPQELGLLKLWVQQGAKGEVVDNRKVEWQSLPPGLNPIFSTALTPDGQYAAAGRANQIFLYHIPSKALATRLTDPALAKLPMYKQGVAHRDMIHSLQFNDEGTLLASGGYREVKLWRRQPAKAPRSIALNSDAAIIALSSDGQSLAAAEGNNIRLINPNTGAAIKTLAGHKSPVNTVAFSPDNTRLLSGAADGAYHIWTIADGKYVAPKLEMAKPSKITAATWTTGGKLLVTAHEDNTIRSWDLATALTINATAAKALADAKESAAAKQKAFDTADKAAKAATAKAATAKANATKATTASTTAAKASADAAKVVTTAKAAAAKGLAAFTAADKGAQDAEAKAKKIASDANKKKEEKDAANKVAAEKRNAANTAKTDSDKAKAAETAAVKVAAAKAKAATDAKTVADKAKTAVAATDKVAADTKKAGDTAKAELDKAKTAETTAAKAGLKPLKEMKGHSQPILSLARVPNNDTQILSGSRDGTVRHWDANTGAAIRSMTHGGPVVAVAISPDTTRFASASENNTAKIWNATDGKQIAELRGQRDQRLALATREREHAFAKSEVTYHTNNLKGKTDAQKKADDRLNKADEAKKKAEGMPIAEKKKALDVAIAAKKTGEEAYNKLKADYDNEVKVFPELDKVAKEAEAAAAKEKTDAAKPIADLAAKEKDAATKKTAAANAKNVLDGALNKQQKPAETKLAVAQKAVIDAATTKANADKALTAAKTAKANAKKAFDTADKVAKDAEATAKKIAGDKDKKKEEKDAAAKIGVDKRKLADMAKTALTQTQTKEKTAQTGTTTAATKLTQSQAAQKTAETALTTAKTNVANATKASQAAEKASADAAKLVAAAKPIADKAKSAQTAAEKLATDKRKVATDSKTKRDKLNTDQAAAKKKLDETAKKVTAAETEYKKLEEPRQQSVNEFNLATKAKAKADGEVKVATEGKTAAEAHQKQKEAGVNSTKEIATKGERPIRAIAFSPDSSTVATGGDDNLIHTWAAANGQPLGTFNGHMGAIKVLAYMPAGQLITGSADKTARVWNLAVTWKLERTLGSGDLKSAITDRVYAIDFSPDGKHIALGSGEPSRGGEIVIWNVADGKLLKNFMGLHGDTVFGLEYSPDGKHIASASGDKFVKVTAVKAGKIVHAFEGHTHHALGVSWLPHGRQLVSVGADNSVRHWNFELGERIRQRTNIGKEVTSIHYVGYTDQAIVTAGDKSVRLIKSDLNDARSFSGGTDFMYTSDATPDGKIVIAGGQDSALRVWNMADGKVVATFESPQTATEKK
jgi:WD40 repeat protein